MINLEKYSIEELSLIVFNTEKYYNEINNIDNLEKLLRKDFTYSNDQWNNLLIEIHDYNQTLLPDYESEDLTDSDMYQSQEKYYNL